MHACKMHHAFRQCTSVQCKATAGSEERAHHDAVRHDSVVVPRGNCAVVGCGGQDIAEGACDAHTERAHKGTCNDSLARLWPCSSIVCQVLRSETEPFLSRLEQRIAGGWAKQGAAVEHCLVCRGQH